MMEIAHDNSDDSIVKSLLHNNVKESVKASRLSSRLGTPGSVLGINWNNGYTKPRWGVREERIEARKSPVK